MSETWDRYSSSQHGGPREFLVSAELYVSSAAGFALRKPTVIRKKPDKRDSAPAAVDEHRLRDRTSWQALSKNLGGSGQWRSATCKLSEEGERCFLNIYVDEATLYQTVYLHLLNQTDIRQADPSLFFRKDCVGLYCIAGQRWTSVNTAEPIYLQFANSEVASTWLALLRSYAIPEIYGRWFFPVDGGSYRMWRQIELSVIQGRNIGAHRSDIGFDISDLMDVDIESDVSCEVHLNDVICGRTTAKKRMATSLDWHEKFVFTDLPPFETLDIFVWREKKITKPVSLGLVQISLSNFRRGEATEGWFPLMQTQGGSAKEGQMGELRLKIRVDEEIILPYSAYTGLLTTFNSRNFLDWMTDLEAKLKLKNISTQLMSLAIAKDVHIQQIQDFAAREVLGTPVSHQTLFRGNTVLTKVMELAMTWYGKGFLEASIGHVLRKLCAEKVTIEVDPMKSTKSTKDLERNVDQLIYWCNEFWNQIYKVRNECPNELRHLFQTIRKLVEERCRPDNGLTGVHRDLPKQSVSAFCFLRFIVPAILHPHLFGLCPGLPPEPVQRSLTLIAKVIQSLANLNASVQKESFMGGVRDFLSNSLPAMVDYIGTVSTPLDDLYSSNPALAIARHNRLHIVNSLRERSSQMSILDKEAIPIIPHLLDIPRHLAVVTSAVIRSIRDPSIQPTLVDIEDTPLDDFRSKCLEVEERALLRVTQLAAKLSARRPSLPVNSMMGDMGPPPSFISPPTASPKSGASSTRKRKTARPSTAPSSGSNSSRRLGWDESMLSSPRIFSRAKPDERKLTYDSKEPPRPFHKKVPSTDSVPTLKSHHPPPSPQVIRITEPSLNDISDDIGKRKKGLFRGILRR